MGFLKMGKPLPLGQVHHSVDTFFTFFSSTIIMYVCQRQYVKSFSCDNATVVSGHGLWTYIGAYWALDRREGGREEGGGHCAWKEYTIILGVFTEEN